MKNNMMKALLKETRGAHQSQMAFGPGRVFNALQELRKHEQNIGRRA